MVKYCVMLKRPASMSREEMHEWWLKELAPIARRTPGLRKYVVSFTVEDRMEEGPDGMGELWFDSVEDAKAGLASPEFEACKPNVLGHGIILGQRMIAEEHVVEL